MTDKIIILSLLGLAVVYAQTPCSHSAHEEPKQSEASNQVSKYEPVPAAQELLNREYLPPSDAAVPEANQAQPVYVAPPQPKTVLPKLQPLPQSTYVRPVYQPLPSTVQPVYQPLRKVQPIPQATYERPVYQPLPKLQPLPQATYVKPVVQPLPKLQPLPQPTNVRAVYQPLPQFQPKPQATYVRPVVQPLPRLQPLPSTVQPQYVPRPLPKLQPLPSAPRPVITQTLPPSTLKASLPTQSAPTYRLPALKPVQPYSPKQIVPQKTSQPKDNEVQASNSVRVNFSPKPVPQATNVVPKIVRRPDLDTAAQTNRLSYVNPDNIRINHYICEQGDPQQKFLCDILKLWDIQHPKEITSNDLDNPGDNSNFNPTYVRLPSSPRPTYAPLPSSPRPTYAPLPSSPRPTYAPLPSSPRPTYAPLPSSPRPTYAPLPSTPRPTYAPLPSTNRPTYAPLPSSTTTTTTTTEQPEKDFDIIPGDSQQNENAVYLPPYSTTPEPAYSSVQSTTVEIPKRVVSPSNDNINVITPDETETSPSTLPYPTSTESTTTTTTFAPIDEGYDYPKPSIPFPVPEKDGYDYPKPAIPFSDGVSNPSVSSGPVSSFNAPAPLFGSSIPSDGRFSETLNQFPFGFPPLASFSDSVQYQPLVSSPIVTSTTIAPDLFFKSNSEFLSSPAFSYSYQPLQQSVTTISPLPTVTYSAPTFSTVSPLTFSTPAPPTVSYTSQPAFSQSLSTLAPLLLSKESLALSSTPATPLSAVTTQSPLDKSSQLSTERPAVTSTTSAPFPASFSSPQFGQFGQSFNSLSPVSYNFPSFPSFEQSTISPISYSFDNSLSGFNSLNYQPFFGQSFSTYSPLSEQSFSSISPYSGQSFSSISPYSEQSFSSISPYFGQSFSTISPLSGQSFSTISPLSGQSFSTISPLSVQSSTTQSPIDTTTQLSTEKSAVTTTPPSVGSFGSQQFGQFSNSLSPSFGYNFPTFDQFAPTASPLNYNFDQSSALKTNFSSFNFQPFSSSFSAPSAPLNYNLQPIDQSFNSFSSNFSSFNYQPLSGQPLSEQGAPISYNFQPLGQSFFPSQSFNFPSSFSSGLSQPSDSPAVSYTGSTPSPFFNFQAPSQFDGSLVGQTSTPPPQNAQSAGVSSESQFGQGGSSSNSLFGQGGPSSFGKSGLSFGSNVQSVENLKDLQATARQGENDFRAGAFSSNGQGENNQFAATYSQNNVQQAPRKSSYSEGKEDITLGNIEILKVKRKSSTKNH